MANQIYDNFVLENALENQLTTGLDMALFLTVDNSLALEAGMKKKVHVYSGTGDVEDLQMGSGNSASMEIGFIEKEYEVGVTQGRGVYYDEQAMRDPFAIDSLVKYMGDTMINDFTEKAINEMKNAELGQVVSTWNFDAVVDAISKMPIENATGGFMLVHRDQLAALRKNLKDDLKYVEAFARSGYIGTVAGFNVYVSNAVPSGLAFLGFKEAVTAFIKKGIEVEQERDANTRKNSVFNRKVALVAFTDANKLVMMGAGQATAATITTYTAEAKTVAGAATTGATVEVYINGKLDKTATAADSAYSVTCSEDLASGDKVKVIAKLDGYINSVANKTVV